MQLYITHKYSGCSLLDFLVFMTLPHMKTVYIARIPSVDLLFDTLRRVSFLIIVFWHVIKKKPVSLIVLAVALWRVFYVYSTIVNEGKVYDSIVVSFSIVSIVLLYDVAYNSRKVTFLSAQLFCFELFIYINLFTELVYPDGMYYSTGAFISNKNWFLGYYNNHTQYFIPALMFA